MRLFSAAFDLLLLPIAVLHDVVDPFEALDRGKSHIRQRIERIEDELS